VLNAATAVLHLPVGLCTGH